MTGPVSRRDFARLFALGGSAALFADPAWARQAPSAPALDAGGAAAGEAFWTERARPVRDAARSGGDERRQPLPGLAAGARSAARARRTASITIRRPTTARGCIRRKRTRARRWRSSCASRLTRSSSPATPASRTTSCRTASTSRPATKSSSTTTTTRATSTRGARRRSGLVSRSSTVAQKNPHPGHGVLRRRVHARHHAAHEGHCASRICRARSAI